MKYVKYFLTVFLVVAPASAHHSSSSFDREREVSFQGTVVRFQWRNPHVYISVKDDNDVEWLIETGATPIMRRSGWTRDSFKSGDIVSVRAIPDRNVDKKHVLLISIEGPDGVAMASLNRKGARQFSNIGASTTNFTGVWSGERAETVAFMQSSARHPLTMKGQEAREQYDQSMNPRIKCIPWATPFFMLANGFYLTEVSLHEDRMVIRNEFYDAERTIYLDDRGHPEHGERTIQGHSIGNWEGDTLIVDTTLFADNRSPIPDTGIPSGSEKHVVERWTLSDDGTQIHFDIVLRDPEYLAEPITAEFVWNFSPQYEALSVECNPDVARRYLE